MNEKIKKKISRFLSLVLRHKPEELDLDMDKEGWVRIRELLSKLKNRNPHFEISREELQEIIDTNNKKRFQTNEMGTHIRACQGHSINVDLGLEPQKPPQFLYHGTATRNLESIFELGINKGSRQHVHLSEDYETAMNVGKRHSKKVGILKINAWEMDSNGYDFYKSDNGVWLTDNVPSCYLVLSNAMILDILNQ